jgi:2-methylisocitrate lyase-like PEP mutase family enzyme
VDEVISQQSRGEAFRALHSGSPFVIPNPWDAGTAKVFAALGFQALATTSAGYAFTLGRQDGDVTLDEVVEHIRALSAATSLPLSVDLENGYGPDPADAARAISRAAEAGAVGGSIEDYDPEEGFYSLEHATERIAAAVEAAGRLDFPFTVTARAENYFRDNPDLDDTITRLQAFERAGADVIYAPRIGSEEVRALSDATSKPLNVLAGPGLSVAEIIDAGGQRISVGGRLTWVAINAMADAAEELREGADLPSLADPTRIIEWLSA